LATISASGPSLRGKKSRNNRAFCNSARIKNCWIFSCDSGVGWKIQKRQKPESAFAVVQSRKRASLFLNSVQIVKEVFAGFVRQRIIWDATGRLNK
jgi:hypothetical protein